MTAVVLRGDARRLPLPDASVDLVVTSPPYYALRSYTDGGEHYAGQIGSEATPQEYIAALLACTREWVRVLKPSGSLFVDLGDKYAGQGGGARGATSARIGRSNVAEQHRGGRVTGAPAKSLMLLPERYRIAAVDQLGLIARAVIVWNKPNGLPESVQDRVRRSHEDWVHLVKQSRYYAAVDEIRQPHKQSTLTRGLNRAADPCPSGDIHKGRSDWTSGANPLGALPGSVWTIPTEPLQVPAELGVDHFAAFPTEWPRRIILGWSPSGICTACGEGRRPVSTSRITGEACACPAPTAPTRPALVTDPFGGTGTVALVAKSLGRVGITVDRSTDYCRLAQWRTSDPGQLAKVLGVPKPPAEVAGQLDLLESAS